MNNKTFYKTFLNIGLPIAIGQLIMSSLNFIDVLMIGGLGESAVAAVSIANKMVFIFIVSIFGIYSAGGIFASQYFGAKNIKALHQIMGIMLTFGLGFAVIAVVILSLFSTQVMSLFSNDAKVIALSTEYLRIVTPAFFVIAISFVYAYLSRSIHMTKVPMYINAISLSINTILNFILINGHLGMPKLGVTGAAIASDIARVIELLLFIYVVYHRPNHPLKTPFSDLTSFTKLQVVNFIKKGTPVILNEMSWVVGQTVFVIAYGLLGTVALSSTQVAMTISDIFVAFFTGISTACAVMIGNALGQSKKELAKDIAHKFTVISFAVAAIFTVLILGFRYLIPVFYYSFDPETIRLAGLTTIVMALYQIPKMYNYVVVIGVLRSGGDTFYCMLVDLIGVWAVGIPLAFFTAGVLHWPIYLVVAASYFEEIVKAALNMFRVRSGKWLNNLVEEV